MSYQMQQVTDMILEYMGKNGNIRHSPYPVLPLASERNNLRRWISEELDELADADVLSDINERIDAFMDIAFLAFQGMLASGVDPGAAMMEVCRSNLTRFRAGDSRDSRGKHIKSPLSEPPDINRVFAESAEKFFGTAPQQRAESWEKECTGQLSRRERSC